MHNRVINRGMIQVGPMAFMDAALARKQGVKPYKGPASAAPSKPTPMATPKSKPVPAASGWSKRFSDFAARGDYSLGAAMTAGFSNDEIHKLVADGWVTPPRDRGIAVAELGANFHEAVRRGLVR